MWLFCSFCHFKKSKRIHIFKRACIWILVLTTPRAVVVSPHQIFLPTVMRTLRSALQDFWTGFHFPVTRAIMPQSHSSPTALTLKYLPLLALQIHFCQPFNSIVFLHNCCHISTPTGAMTYTGTSAGTDRCLWNRSSHSWEGLVVLEWTWFYEDSDCESLLKALKLKQCFPFMFWSFSFWQFMYLNQARC